VCGNFITRFVKKMAAIQVEDSEIQTKAGPSKKIALQPVKSYS
jgi:hypothetical protein